MVYRPILSMLLLAIAVLGCLTYRDYGYSTLCLHLAIWLRKLSSKLIDEAGRAKKQQKQNEEIVKERLLAMDDDYFVMVNRRVKEIEG